MNHTETILKVLSGAIGGSLLMLLVHLMFKLSAGGDITSDLWIPGALAGAELGLLACLHMHSRRWGLFAKQE